jgi:acyl carrier protein
LAPDARDLELAAWLDAPSADRHEHFVTLVRKEIAELLRFDSTERVKGNSRLIDLGLDSLMAIELRNRLAKSLRLKNPLSSTLVFDYPTPDAVAFHLESELLGAGDAPAAALSEDFATAERASELAELDDADVEEMLIKKLQSL